MIAYTNICVIFYPVQDKYTMQLYGRAVRDYVARNDKELTVMSGERVEVSTLPLPGYPFAIK